MQSICAGGAQLELGQDLDWFERRGWRVGGEGRGGGLTGQGKKKEPRDGKWSTSNPKVDNLNGFVDMTGTLLKLGSDNTYLD